MENIMNAIREAGGTPYYVGGCVRDLLVQTYPKDIDIEVFGLSPDKLKNVLSSFGVVNEVGSSFGVLKLSYKGQEYDFSLPRTETKIGEGHTGFNVKVDEMLSISKAASRRDFTINAIYMATDNSGQLSDPFGGFQDLKDRSLNATSFKFKEDPLRVLRGVQFAGRFQMTMGEPTIKMCRELLPEAGTISIERIQMEMTKWALKSVKPSMGLQVLLQTGWIELFPELHAVMGLHQNPTYHPEGCVLTHTGLVCDAAVDIAVREKLSDEDRLVLVLAALCHDLGKATTTHLSEDGRIVSPRHAQEGVEPTISLLTSMGFQKSVIDKVVPLVSCHMDHLGVTPNKSFVRKLSNRLFPSNVSQLAMLIEADVSGRAPLPKRCPDNVKAILRISQDLGVEQGKPMPLVMGRHLIDLGMNPSPDFKTLLDQCFEAQLEGEFSDLDEGIEFAKMLTKK